MEGYRNSYALYQMIVYSVAYANHPIFWSSPGLIDLLNSGVSVHTSTKSFSDFDLIFWCVGRPRPDMHTSVTSSRSKVKVTDLLKFQKLYFSRSISSTVFAWSWKLMVGSDSMGPVVHRVGARFLNFLLGSYHMSSNFAECRYFTTCK